LTGNMFRKTIIWRRWYRARAVPIPPMDAPIVLVEARNTIEFKYVEGRRFVKKFRPRTQRRTVI
jgi:hypothetical protein